MSFVGNLTLALAWAEMSTMQDLVVLENFAAYLSRVSASTKDRLLTYDTHSSAWAEGCPS
jgi:hypothetical protein